MKRWILLLVLAIGITAIVTVSVQFLPSDASTTGPEFPAPLKQEGPAPKLVIDEDTVYKFNVLAQETKGKHEWTFKNEGPGVLEVRGESVTCSCTTSDLFDSKDLKAGKSMMIPPGESRQVTVNWDTKKFEGPYRQFVKVATNDPDRPSLDLVIQGTVKQPLITLPPDSSVSFLNVSNEEPSVRRVIVTSPDHPEMKITGTVSSNPELLGAEVSELPAEEAAKYKFEKAFQILVTLKHSPNLGDFNEQITVETDHPSKKFFVIKAKGKITGPISLIPDKVTMPNASSLSGGSQEMTIWSRNRSSVNFTVDKKPKGIEVAIAPLSVAPDGKASSYKMTVKLEPGQETGPLEDEIVLKTDDPKASEIHVPVSLLIKGSR
jgi:hypothetical protein